MALIPNRRSVMTLYSDVMEPASHAVRFVLAEKAINVIKSSRLNPFVVKSIEHLIIHAHRPPLASTPLY